MNCGSCQPLFINYLSVVMLSMICWWGSDRAKCYDSIKHIAVTLCNLDFQNKGGDFLCFLTVCKSLNKPTFLKSTVFVMNRMSISPSAVMWLTEAQEAHFIVGLALFTIKKPYPVSSEQTSRILQGLIGVHCFIGN